MTRPYDPKAIVTDQADNIIQDVEPVGKRERTKAANKEAILDAARLVFAELGYEATTVRDIIRGTNLASGTFYNYFKSKDEIRDALVHQTVTEFGRLFLDMKQTSMSLREYLRCAFGAYFRFLARQHEEVLKLSSPHISRSVVLVESPEMRAVFREIRNDLETFIDREGIEGIDTEYLTATAIGMAREIGDIMLHRMARRKDPSLIDEAIEFATGQLLNGLHHPTDTFRT